MIGIHFIDFKLVILHAFFSASPFFPSDFLSRRIFSFRVVAFYESLANVDK